MIFIKTQKEAGDSPPLKHADCYSVTVGDDAVALKSSQV